MAAPFGRKNPRPVYKARLIPPPLSKPKTTLYFTSNKALYACVGAVIVVLVLGAVTIHL